MKNCYAKTTFSFTSAVIYKWNDGVSIGSSLGSILAKVIIIEIGKEIVKPLTQKFDMRYEDDTLLLAKE